jgi:hypothetical protein
MKRTIVALFLILLPCSFAFAQGNQSLKLWYQKPAGDNWVEALPV